jgi:transcriptional regulator GlxA family with amidase domain
VAKRAVPSPLSRLVNDIREHPETRRTIEGMAREIGQSESLFTASFKRMTGFPPAAFIAHCRIGKARDMLLKPSLSIAGIARSLGFSSAAHFSNQFRLFYGMSPRAYRNSAQSR